MSYSLNIHCRTWALAGAMEVFMKDNFRPWSALLGKPEHNDRMAQPERLETNPRVISIWYSCPEPERDYAWDLAHWIAYRAGRKLPFYSLGGSFPYVVYDGDDKAFPVVPEDFVVPESGKERWGYLPFRGTLGYTIKDNEIDTRRRASTDEFLLDWQAQIDAGRATIKAEILRLDELWVAQFAPKPWVV